MPTNPVFDRLFAEAAPVVLAGEHRRDEPPVDGGRWPVSVVAVPDEPTRDVLAQLLDEALAHAGPGHFETGRTDTSHLTVRALEPYREAAAPDDDITREWAAALDEVGRACPPVTLRLTGVTLTVGGVLVQAEPVDDVAWRLMRTLREALGPLAWFEDRGDQRDIWYSSILHLAGPVRDADGLVAWVGRHRDSLRHDVVLDALTLVRYRYCETHGHRRMAMEPWHRTPLTARAEQGAGAR